MHHISTPQCYKQLDTSRKNDREKLNKGQLSIRREDKRNMASIEER
jgi:hypothetical protein